MEGGVAQERGDPGDDGIDAQSLQVIHDLPRLRFYFLKFPFNIKLRKIIVYLLCLVLTDLLTREVMVMLCSAKKEKSLKELDEDMTVIKRKWSAKKIMQ